MRKQMFGGLAGVLTLSLAACGGPSAPTNLEQAGGVDPYTYVLDGEASTAEAVERLSKQAELTYLMPSDNTSVVHVFTTDAGFEAHKQQLIQPQALCVSLRTKTTIYDGTSYSGDQEDILKGTSLPDLTFLLRNNSAEPNWNTPQEDSSGNIIAYGDISSIKMADCKYTRLYTGTNYTGSKLERKGGNLSLMPAGFNNVISSVKVDP